MKCVHCHDDAQLKEKNSHLSFCGKSCQKKYHLGLKVYAYDSKSNGPILVKDDPNIVGLLSNDGTIFEISKETLAKFETISHLNESTDSPISIDAPSKVIDTLLNYYRHDEIIPPLTMIGVFKLADFLGYEQLLRHFLTRNDLFEYISRLTIKEYQTFKFLNLYFDKILISNDNNINISCIDNCFQKKNKELLLIILNKLDNLSINQKISICIILIRLNDRDILEYYVNEKVPTLDLGHNNQQLLKGANVNNFRESLKFLISTENRGVVLDEAIIVNQIEFGNLEIVKMLFQGFQNSALLLSTSVKYDRENITNFLLSNNLSQLTLQRGLISAIIFNRNAFDQILQKFRLPLTKLFETCALHNNLEKFKRLEKTGKPSNIETIFVNLCGLGFINFSKYIIENYSEIDFEYGLKVAEENEQEEMVEYLKSLIPNKRLKNF